MPLPGSALVTWLPSGSRMHSAAPSVGVLKALAACRISKSRVHHESRVHHASDQLWSLVHELLAAKASRLHDMSRRCTCGCSRVPHK